MRRPTWTICLVLFLLAASGCSWVMVRQAPEDYDPQTATGPPRCTASLGPPISDIWDTVGVGGGLVATGTATMLFTDVDPAFGIAQIGAGAGLGAMFGASAAHGFPATRRCRKLRDRFQESLGERLNASSGEPPDPSAERTED